MNTEIDVQAYVQDLEKHLQLSLFGGQVADPEGAVLLVRGALAGGDPGRAAATPPPGLAPPRWRTPAAPGPARAARTARWPCSTRPTRCMRSSARPTARPGSGPGCARWAPGCATGPIRTGRPSAGTA